jgi:uncharacterized membrane protein SpoIIM required for sporulation
MLELVFIRNNKKKWQQEELTAKNSQSVQPDELADAYQDITADLAYAQTHYPESRVTMYLNDVATMLHNRMYANKHEKWSRFLTFFTREVPDVMYKERRLLLISLIIFLASIIIGVISQLGDTNFCRIILGNQYVDMTLDNIAAGKPMAVYASGAETSSFLEIMGNNIYVAFREFAFGILTSIATAWQLFMNGVMVGCFEGLFYQHGILGESLLAVMLHGTLELSAIVIAGAAGLALGNGWLFPGTYSRLTSFRMGAKRGLKIVVGTVPAFIVAAFIEGFITRHTEIPDAIRLSIIIISLAFVIFYYVLWPWMLNKDRSRKNLRNLMNTKENIINTK